MRRVLLSVNGPCLMIKKEQNSSAQLTEQIPRAESSQAGRTGSKEKRRKTKRKLKYVE